MPKARPIEIQMADSIVASLMEMTWAVLWTASRSNTSMPRMAAISAPHAQIGTSKLAKLSRVLDAVARSGVVRAWSKVVLLVGAVAAAGYQRAAPPPFPMRRMSRTHRGKYHDGCVSEAWTSGRDRPARDKRGGRAVKHMFPVEELARDERFVRTKIEDAILDPRNTTMKKERRSNLTPDMPEAPDAPRA
jgi:hypothetical protein